MTKFVFQIRASSTPFNSCERTTSGCLLKMIDSALTPLILQARDRQVAAAAVVLTVDLLKFKPWRKSCWPSKRS